MGQVLDMFARKVEELDEFQVLLAELTASIASHDVHVDLVVPDAPNVLIDSDCVEPVGQFDQVDREEHVN